MPSKRQSSLAAFFKKPEKRKAQQASGVAGAAGAAGAADVATSDAVGDLDAPPTAKKIPATAGVGAGAATSLSPEQKELIVSNKKKALAKKLALMGPFADLPGTWADLLQDELTKPYFLALMTFLKKEYSSKKVFPPQEEVYEALRRCDAADVKVVIIGQDPYHNHNQAHGLCFSVREHIRPPPSLKNIYKELASDLGKMNFAVPTHGCLEKWADRGVLLLNTCLTVQAHQPYSHRKKGWEQFTDALISKLSKQGGKDGKRIVFLTWGRPAQKKALHVDKKRHTILSSSHPSPLGATKTAAPFITSRCFSKCNAALEEAGLDPIDWSL